MIRWILINLRVIVLNMVNWFVFVSCQRAILSVWWRSIVRLKWSQDWIEWHFLSNSDEDNRARNMVDWFGRLIVLIIDCIRTVFATRTYTNWSDFLNERLCEEMRLKVFIRYRYTIHYLKIPCNQLFQRSFHTWTLGRFSLSTPTLFIFMFHSLCTF